MPITDAHKEHYLEHGYAIVEEFLTKDELERARNELREIMPGWIEYCDGLQPETPEPTQHQRFRNPFHFPYSGQTLNRITVHAGLHDFAKEMAGNVEMYCEQSHLSFKHKGHPGDVDQGMHYDYGNHTLAYPPKLPEYWQTAYLLYYTDVDLDHAPTAVCSWKHYPEKISYPMHCSREQRPEIYENEVKVTVPAGGMLIYSMRTYHRGTPFLKPGARIGQFITYAPAAWKWLGIVGWSKEAIRPEFYKWISSATPEERTLLGFPPPGHSYWTDETLQGVSKRYPNMDMSPYKEAAQVDSDEARRLNGC